LKQPDFGPDLGVQIASVDANILAAGMMVIRSDGLNFARSIQLQIKRSLGEL
jgi:hypothetical protein